jgi:hypothetical protein
VPAAGQDADKAVLAGYFDENWQPDRPAVSTQPSRPAAK